MLPGAIRRVAQALRLEVFDVDVLQAAQADAIVEDFARGRGMGMHLQQRVIARDHCRDAAHVDDRLADGLDIQVLAF